MSGQQHAPVALYPRGKTRYPFYRRLGGPQGRSGRAENLVPTGIRSRTVQPVAQSLYRLSYRAHTKRSSLGNSGNSILFFDATTNRLFRHRGYGSVDDELEMRTTLPVLLCRSMEGPRTRGSIRSNSSFIWIYRQVPRLFLWCALMGHALYCYRSQVQDLKCCDARNFASYVSCHWSVTGSPGTWQFDVLVHE